MAEAEATVRRQMRNKKGVDAFANSARTVTFNRLMGLSTASAYKQPAVFSTKSLTKKTKASQKDSSGFDKNLFSG